MADRKGREEKGEENCQQVKGVKAGVAQREMRRTERKTHCTERLMPGPPVGCSMQCLNLGTRYVGRQWLSGVKALATKSEVNPWDPHDRRELTP